MNNESASTRLPEVFVDATGERVTEPAYRLTGDVYLGETLWEDGEVIITQVTPNGAMEPLNRAAQVKIEQWLGTLPALGRDLRLEEIVEAANMLRPQEGVPQMSREQYNTAVIQLAVSLREKRGAGLQVPQPRTTVRSGNGGKIPVMPNARVSDARAAIMGGSEPSLINQPQRQSPVRKPTTPPVGSMADKQPA